MIVAVNYFRKTLHRSMEYLLNGDKGKDSLMYHCSEYGSGSEYARALNILGMNMPGVWICQGSEYGRVLNKVPGLQRVLNMPDDA